ncbi:MAG: InlB B-repeat-containing protein [Candidatus Symbiothrix sp.]|jgi:uncharacterized repeat protein (TIGR02543 family)|nr:InlB B-repeat-containing protein [Candidatus Symbiothrix sp.]
MSTTIQKFGFLCLFLVAGISAWAQQTLPTSGEYYVIKNYASSTYIGGSGSGNDAVKNEASGTNDIYHVFSVTGNNTDGWTLKQPYTGNEIRYNNQWTMSYKTSGDNVLWILVDQTDYFVINRKGQSNGIGGDNVASGNTLYSNKTETATLPNKWLFDANEARSICLTHLQAVIDDAQSFHDANSTVAGASDLQTAINTANAVVSNGTTQDLLDAIAPLQTAKQAFVSAIALANAIANASFDNPVDLTVVITNPAFDNNTKDGWTGTGTANYHEIENYQVNFDFYQVLSGLPAGKYELKVQGFQRPTGNSADQVIAADNGTDVKVAKLYATGATEINLLLSSVYSEKECTAGWENAGIKYPNSMADAETAFNAGKYENTLSNIVVTSAGTLTIGVKSTYTSGVSGQWILFDNFRLTYYGEVYAVTFEVDGGSEVSTQLLSKTGDGLVTEPAAPNKTGYTFDGWYADAGLNTLFNFATAISGDVTIYAKWHDNTPDAIATLIAAYTPAKAFYDGIDESDVMASGDPDEAGKYSYTNYTALGNALTAAANILNDWDESTSTYSGSVSVIDILAAAAAIAPAQAACTVYVALNTIPDGEYYIKVGNYYFNNFGTINQVLSTANNGLQTTKNITDGHQIFTVAKLSGTDHTTVLTTGRYSIFNVFNSAYHITEEAVFRDTWGTPANAGDDLWRTFNIYYNGTAYAIQRKAGNSDNVMCYWTFDGAVLKPATATSASYIFDFIPVATVFAEEIAAGRALYNTATEGNGDGQYAAAVLSAFDAALDVAEAISVGTKEDLFVYAAALAEFIPNKVYSADETLTASARYYNVTVNAGVTLTVPTGVSLTADNTLTLKSNDADGTAQIVTDGSVVANGAVVDKTVSYSANSWYPIGFPFELNGVYAFSEYLTAHKETAGVSGDYWLKTYTSGAETVSQWADTIEANTGYVVAFPTAFNNTEVSFISASGVNISNAGFAPSGTAAYALIANPTLQNITLADGGNYYYYTYVAASNRFLRIAYEGDATLQPFESFIVAYTTDPSSLRSSFSVEEATDIPYLRDMEYLDDPIVKTEYYNLQGIRYSISQRNGISNGTPYIVKEVRQSGRVTSKVISGK